ncbi:MAG: glycoside hydrolase family 2 protein [Saprospiraceae bacterium]|nr:glycoside hydrolase family 2 protein [Candidatus Vicinibacter affinis]
MTPEIKLLNKTWHFRQLDQKDWTPCAIPGFVHKILFENGDIPPLYYSQNESTLQWIGEKDWIFKCIFDVDSIMLLRKKIELQFARLDTYAKLSLNGTLLGETNNAFRTWKFECKQLLKASGNELIVHFTSTQRKSQEIYQKLPTALPGEIRVVSRKPQFHFGWDFGPKYITMGFGTSPSLIAYDDVMIENLRINTLQLKKTHADLELVLDGQSNSLTPYEINIDFGSTKVTRKVWFSPAFREYRLKFKIKNPELWWPNGSGKAKLYDVKITCKDTLQNTLYESNIVTGIRTISLVHKPDKWGKSFYFLVNNKPVFSKGANYIPRDLFQTAEDSANLLLEDLQKCNFNMIRIWGGGQYETDQFYSKCDQLGLLVWQDFMFACGMYPGDQDFMENVRLEAEEQVKRISAHPCVAIWCGNNENNEGWQRWGWQIGLDASTKNRLWNDYTHLFNQLLPKIVKENSNSNSYWESSPLFGRGDSKFRTEGDAHDWGIWHDEMKFEEFEQRIPRFMSEMGFQALPALTTIKTFAPEEDLNLDSKSLLAHQKHPRGNKLIYEYLQRDLPSPTNFKSLIYLNQLNQAEGIGLAITAHRLAKPYCMGTLYWQLNDCWPGISWSSIDYWGRWKALQHKTKNVFQPVLVSAKTTGDKIEIFANSDKMAPILVTVKIAVQTLDKRDIALDTLYIKMGTQQCKRIYTLDKIKLFENLQEDQTVLKIDWNYDSISSQSLTFFTKLKHVKFRKPTFKIDSLVLTNEGYKFLISSTEFCKAVYIEENESSSFFPNFFDLAPGEQLSISCKTQNKSIDLKDLEIISLYDHLEK